MDRAERDFQFVGATIRVEASAADLDWFEEFLAPQFSVGRPAPPDQHVRTIVNPGEYAELAARGPDVRGRTVDCFTLDSGIVTAAVWNAAGDGVVAFDEALGVFYRRQRDAAGAVEVLTAQPGAGLRVAVMRIVREFGMRYAQRAGWLIVHAAALAVEDEAVVMLGPKRVGKTTLLAHLLLERRGQFLANDRVALRREGAAVIAAGIPTIVSVRRSSGEWLPMLDAGLVGTQYHHRLTLAESHGRPAPEELRPASAWSLSPRQFCRLLGVEAKAAAPVTALLFPALAPTGDGVVVERLPADEALARLTGSLLRRCPGAGMFDVDDQGAGDGLSLSPVEVVAHVPSFVCRLGINAYQHGTRWLDRLQASARGKDRACSLRS